MPRTRPPYAPEFRRQMVELVRAGRDPTDLAREFDPSAQAIRNWVAEADRSEGRRETKSEVLTAAEREELTRLRREVRQLRLEREPKVSEATSSQKPRPGLHGRPARCRRTLPVHEREPGRLPRRGHGARARRVRGRLPRLAATRAFGSRRGRCRPAEADPHGSRWLGRNLRRAARARHVGGAGRTTRAQAHRAADARGGPRWGEPSARWRRDHAAGQGGATRP